MESAVVLFIYNRPDLTARVFDAIRGARPRRLFVFADAPLLEKLDDAALADAARVATETVDWPCAVHRDYAGAHLGIKRRVESGLDRVFAEMETAIVLEDDHLPEPSFFSFATELLHRYRDDAAVMTVCGCRLIPVLPACRDSYSFSRYPFIGGWATWRRAWRLYDGGMQAWERLRRTSWLTDRLRDRRAVDYWTYLFDAERQAGDAGNWDMAWVCTSWVHAGLAIVPAVNLISNLGFRADATHTRDSRHHLSALPSSPLTFPLNHPTAIVASPDVERLAATHVFSGNLERLMGEVRRRILAAR